MISFSFKMMRISFKMMLMTLTSCYLYGQQMKTNVYAFPGQGADRRLFDSLQLDSAYVLRIIEYGTPDKHATMEEFASALVNRIDTSHPFILLGVSLGGMICAELSEVLKPEKTIIISSSKNWKELPARYKFQKYVPLYKVFPGYVLLGGAKLAQPVVEADRNNQKNTFVSMLNEKDADYMKRTIELIIRWDRKANTGKIYHIHGNNDHTLPLRNVIDPDYVVEGGSHMMTLTRGKDISLLVNKILTEY